MHKTIRDGDHIETIVIGGGNAASPSDTTWDSEVGSM